MPRTFVQPVTIRGVTYPSQRAAAAALGVTEGRVSQAAINGRLHMLGTGPGNHGRVAMPCRGLDGKMYPTLTEAAAAAGVHRNTFRRRMDKLEGRILTRAEAQKLKDEMRALQEQLAEAIARAEALERKLMAKDAAKQGVVLPMIRVRRA
jgi:hypothetical protein